MQILGAIWNAQKKRNERSSTQSHLKESILHDLLEKIPNTKWDDVVGLENAKNVDYEAFPRNMHQLVLLTKNHLPYY